MDQENIEELEAVSAGADAEAVAEARGGRRGRGNGDRSASRHWLLNVASAAGARGASDLATPATTPIDEAWTLVVAGCGITDATLAAMVAERYRLEVADLESANPDVIQRIPERVARKYNAFPLREDDGHLVIATCDPTDHDAEQALRFASRKPPIFEIASPSALRELVNARYSSNKEVEALLSSVDDVHDIRVVQDIGPERVGGAEADAAPIIKLTNVILRDAVRDGASDIHLEPSNGAGVVRLRVDGVLRHHMQMPLVVLNRVISRIKILGELDIADRLRPQDGRSRIQVDGRVHDLRISTVPTRQAEKAVIRVLNPEGNRSLEDLSILPQEMARIRRLLGVREGIVVVTGPTGSGKTTTLYSALREVASGEINVMSVEDPVEYELHGVTQIQVEPERGVTFAIALRAILRQDPDVIFIGEIRDPETAEIAVHAAMTGHLVLATLHTNDAVSSVARLEHLGLDRTSIATTLIGAMAQRLVRRVCGHCAEPVGGDLTTEETRLEAQYGAGPTVRARGCQRCGQTGYRGRLPLVEVATVDSSMREMIARNATNLDLMRTAISAGMRPLMKVAIERVQSGDTTLHEVERVLGVPDDEDLYEQFSPDTAQGRMQAEARREAKADARSRKGGRRSAARGKKPEAELEPQPDSH